MKVGVLQGTAPTTLGSGSFTLSGFGTPVGAIFAGVRGGTNDTADNHAQAGWGFYDGTRVRTVSVGSQNGQAASVCKSWPTNTMAYRLLGPAGTSVDGEFEGNGFATDAVQFDCNDTFAAAGRLAVLLFGGTDCSVQVGSTNSFPSNGGTIQAAPGFPPKVVFTFSNFTGFGAAAAVADSNVSIGVAWNNNGTWENYCISGWEDDAVATTACAAVTRNNRCLVNISGGALVSGVEITASTSTQFTITTRDAAVSVQVGWIAVGWTGSQGFYAGIVDSPTATGSTNWAAGNLPLNMAGLLMTRCATINTIETDADGGPLGYAFVGPAGAGEQSYERTAQDAVVLGTTNTETMPSNDFIRWVSHDGTVTTVSNWTSFPAAGGVTHNVTTASDGTARKWVLFGWQPAPGSSDTDIAGTTAEAMSAVVSAPVETSCAETVASAETASQTAESVPGVATTLAGGLIAAVTAESAAGIAETAAEGLGTAAVTSSTELNIAEVLAEALAAAVNINIAASFAELRAEAFGATVAEGAPRALLEIGPLRVETYSPDSYVEANASLVDVEITAPLVEMQLG